MRFAFFLWLLVLGAAADERLPRLYLLGDSTVHNDNKGYAGWGDVMTRWFDPQRIVVVNCAAGGRSSRSFLREGLWEPVKEKLQPGDFVLIQFGHNDAGEVKDGDGMASLNGIGGSTKEVEGPKGRETVRTYGAYLSTFIADAKARHATPIVCSPVPQNRWKDDRVVRVRETYGRWAKKAAAANGAAFVDLNEIAAWKYESVGRQKVFGYYTPADPIHTTPEGARAHAECVVAGLRKLSDDPFAPYLRKPG